MSQDAYPPTPPGSSPDFDPSAPYTPGNRPASGARRGTPGEVLSQGFQGSQNAGDFLGLDVEFTGSQGAAQYAPDDLSLQGAPTTYAPAAGYGAAPIEEPVPVSEDYSEAPSSFEYGGDLGSEEMDPAFAEEEEPRQKRSGVLIGGAVVALLGAAGYLYGPEMYKRYFGGETEIATRPAPRPASSRSTASTPTPIEDPAAAADPAASSPTSTGAVTPEDEQPLVVKDVPPLASDLPTRRSTTTPAVEDPAETAPASQASAPDLLGALLGASPTDTGAPAFPDLEGAEYEWASEDQLELIWRGATLPLEAVKAPARTMMPRVGNVRVFTTSGDVFDGRLYAVGQNRVWIDAGPGRIGLDGDRVERIEILPAGNLAQGGSEEATAGKRVRVRVPGGLLFGRVLKVDGEDVTLQLDEGGKVRVKSSEIEELGSGRAIVVRR